MNITQGQKKELKDLTRAANRRLERATGGQKRYIEAYIKRVTGGSEKFSASYRGLSAAEVEKKIEQLERFMSKKMTTTKKGWKDFVKNVNKGLSGKGYDLTDEELADILDQIDQSSNEEFYRAVNLVTAKKAEEGSSWDPSMEKIIEVIDQKIDFQNALKMALKANPNIGPKND